MTHSLNIVFVAHCDFTGNSAMQVFSIANRLRERGHSCIVCVPRRAETVLEHGKPRFPVLDYETILQQGVFFPNGRGPDLMHAWTPRELVRKTTVALAGRYDAPFFVHLEDNEMAILVDQLPGWCPETVEALPTGLLDAVVPGDRSHPHRARQMLEEATGVSVLIDRLLELKPANTPGVVFYPGYDPEFLQINGRNDELRASLAVDRDELLIVYPGNVHSSNCWEVGSLFLAVAILNGRGQPTKVVKTGWNHRSLQDLFAPAITRHIIDLGFVPRRTIPQLIAAADVLVQPGRAGAFNDFRVPAKLPEFLASGRPVIMPRTNIGSLLKDGEEALLLDRGDGGEIAAALERLAAAPDLRARLGRAGRAFAVDRLDWEKSVTALVGFYFACLDAGPKGIRGGKTAAAGQAHTKVTVITPSLDHGRFIERTILSVLYQDWPDIEHVVVDGGSTDGTREILEEYGDRVTWMSEGDCGQGDAVNKGLLRTKGEIIGWLNSDDLYYPGAISRVVNFFAANSHIDVVYGNADFIDIDGKVEKEFPTKPWDFYHFQADCFICQPATFFRRSAVERCGFLDTKLIYCMDYEYWLRLASAGLRFARMERKLAASRMYPENKTMRARPSRSAEINNMLVERIGFVPDTWLYDYADALLGRYTGPPKGRARLFLEREIRAMLAGLRWNGYVSGNMLGKIFRVIGTRSVQQLRSLKAGSN